MERKFEGFYYPFSVFEDDRLLKKSLLFFDVVNMCIPSEELLRKEIGRPRCGYPKSSIQNALERLAQFRQETQTLQDAKVLQLFHLPDNQDERVLLVCHCLDFYKEELCRREEEKQYREDMLEPLEEIALIRLKAFAVLNQRFNAGIPFTSDRAMHDNFLKMFQDILSSDNDKIYSLNLPIAQLGMEVLETRLPDFELSSYENVLELRGQLRESLIGFRMEMARLAAKVESEPWEKGYQTELARIMTGKVQPSIQELEKEAEALRYRRVSRWLKDALRPGTSIPLVAAFYVGVPTWAAAGLAAGVLTLRNYFEMRAEQAEFDKNGLSLLFKPALRR